MRRHGPESGPRYGSSTDRKREAAPVFDPRGTLALMLGQAMNARGLSVEMVAERTKLPRPTIRALLGADEPAILPQRVYLRGHVEVLARDLGLKSDAVLVAFDRECPAEIVVEEEHEPRFSRTTVAAAAALSTIGIIAVILAFIR